MEQSEGADVDVERTREQYRIERLRRLRARESRNFEPVRVGSRFEKFGDDIFALPAPVRSARHTDVEVLIIGGGFGGQSVAIELQKSGVTDFLLLEVAGDFGGTWYWNRYPGVRCDIESYMYLPFLEETGYMPSEKYVPGAEIFEYSRLLGRHFGLYDRALFQTRVTGMEWDEAASSWRVATDRGDLIIARFIVSQSGWFTRPQLPAIPGLETFAGNAFHTSRWDYRVTGGSADGGLDKLRGLDVGIIGTGATGIQVIPQLARSARSVTVFQRTPTQVAPRDNSKTDPEWFAALPPGWQKERIHSFDRLILLTGTDECGVDDGWTRFARHQIAAIGRIPEGQRDPDTVAETLERSDFDWNEQLRARVDEIVEDEHKAELLKAYYRTHCKRPGFSDEYLQAFDQDNVSLVDVVETPMESIEPEGVITSEGLHRLDVLIFATGFDLSGSWSERAGYEVIGRNGVKLSELWKDGPITFQGLLSTGLPNLFFMGANQVRGTANIVRGIGEFAEHIAFVISRVRDAGHAVVEADPEAEAQWQGRLRASGDASRRMFEECTPGYFNNEGKVDSPSATGIYRLPPLEAYEELAAWRQKADFHGLIFRESMADFDDSAAGAMR
ncbi:NAD(P)/FAD-dependent oxidoreductase [soil metagenome]